MIVPLGLCGSVWRESLLLASPIWRPFAAAKRCRHAAVMNSDRCRVGRQESTQHGRPAWQRSVPVEQRKRSHYGEKCRATEPPDGISGAGTVLRRVSTHGNPYQLASDPGALGWRDRRTCTLGCQYARAG
jgi:hypothetical protein